MHVFSSVMIDLIVFLAFVFNASAFGALYFFRCPRPGMRARLFRWVLHNEPARRSRHPAQRFRKAVARERLT